MALSFLVDTSVLIRLGRHEVRGVIEPLAARGELGRATISDLDVGYYARNTSEWDELLRALDAFAPIATTAAHIGRALQVQRLLAERGKRVRKIPDLLVAAAAEGLFVTVLHYDADFDVISEVTGQASQWVVPAGRID